MPRPLLAALPLALLLGLAALQPGRWSTPTTPSRVSAPPPRTASASAGGTGTASAAAPNPVPTAPVRTDAAPESAAAATPRAAGSGDEPLPIFDAHIHYSADAWELYDVDAALARLDQANVRVALVSSTPDDGTLRLYARAPERIVPILRPYRTRADMGVWTRDASIAAYVRGRLESAPPGLRYRGIGEFHLGAGEATDPVVAELAGLARQHDLFLHVHGDARTVEELLTEYPEAEVLWAHAGMGASPATVGELLDRFPDGLRVELALRYDVAPGGQLDPAWAALFARHPQRLMIGTDTWIPGQWTRLPELMATAQGWLRQLPPDLAERIAWRNAACLFGGETTALPRPVTCS